MTKPASPTRALDALSALGDVEDLVRHGDDPDGILPAIQGAYGALDDLIDQVAVRADPTSRSAVIDALYNCADQQGDARWHGNRAYYGATDGQLIDITAVIHAYQTLFEDASGWVITDASGCLLLQQANHDLRRPVRARLAAWIGRRRIR